MQFKNDPCEANDDKVEICKIFELDGNFPKSDIFGYEFIKRLLLIIFGFSKNTFNYSYFVHLQNQISNQFTHAFL